MTLTFTNFLGLMFGFAVAERPQSFVGKLSFALPRPSKVLWHQIVQPAREARVYSKPFSLIFRTPWAFVPFAAFTLAAIFVGLVSSFANLINYSFETSLPSYFNSGGADLFLFAGAVIGLVVQAVLFEGASFWRRTIPITAFALGNPQLRTPTFVFERMREICDKAERESADVSFRLKATDQDPILYACVKRKGGAEENFVAAVFLPGNSKPQCQ